MAQIIFNQIPLSANEIIAPGRGAEQWHDRTDVNIPAEGNMIRPFDVYYRTTWNRFEGATENSWNMSWLDGRFKDAISKRQTLSIGIMSVYQGVDGNSGGVQIDGAWSSVPNYLIQRMNTENPKAWKVKSTWVPNINSSYYQGRCLALNQAINNFINTTSYQGIQYKHVIGIIDIRLYGNWGEWHSAGLVDNVNEYPSGVFPTAASLIKIVDAHRLGFPDIPLVAMINGFDAGWLNNIKNPPEIANYLLTAKNNWGEFGWRRDNWGAFDSYVDDELINNNRSFGNSGPFKTLIMQKWTKAPITGEPPSWNPGDYSDLENQVSKYKITSFGNGNYGPDMNTTIKNRVRAASKICGYRFIVTRAETSISGNNLTIAMNWQNVGIGNCYQNWDIVFELVGTSWKGVSKHKLKFFQPKSTTDLVTETFALTGVPAGTYPLKFSIKDPNGYRVNLPLAIEGADSEKKYSLGTIPVGTTPPPPPNTGPTANAGGDKEITLPVDSVLLIGSGSDVDGTIQTMLWERVSGSGTIDSSQGPWGNTTVRGLKEGISVFKLTVTDDKGASNSDSVNVKVNPAVVVPPPPDPDPVGKKVVDVTTALKTISTVIYDDGSQEVFPKV